MVPLLPLLSCDNVKVRESQPWYTMKGHTCRDKIVARKTKGNKSKGTLEGVCKRSQVLINIYRPVHRQTRIQNPMEHLQDRVF